MSKRHQNAEGPRIRRPQQLPRAERKRRQKLLQAAKESNQVPDEDYESPFIPRWAGFVIVGIFVMLLFLYPRC